MRSNWQFPPDWAESLIARTDPDRPALIAGQTVTYGRLQSEIDKWVLELERRGIGRGTTVALQVNRSFTYLYLVYGLWSVGAGIMLVDPRLQQEEANELLDRFRPDYHIRDKLKSGGMPVFREELDVDIIANGQDCCQGGTAVKPYALLQFTSGTTGRPKAVVRSGTSIRAELDRLAAIPCGIQPDDTVTVLASLHHSFGLIGGIMTALSTGAAVLIPSSLQSKQIAQSMAASRATALFAVPLHFELLAGLAESEVGSLRFAVSGGEMLPETIAEKFRERFGVRVGQAYGTSETGMLAADWHGDHPGTVGACLNGIEWDIRDRELLVRLPQSPYADMEGRERYREGWLHTRDAVEALPGSGLIRLQGRLDSIRIIGGLKIDAVETERSIGQHPQIEEARAVFTEDHRLEVYLVGKPGFDMSELLRWCASRMAAYKIPQTFHRVHSLPRTVSGKPIRDPAALAGLHPWNESRITE